MKNYYFTISSYKRAIIIGIVIIVVLGFLFDFLPRTDNEILSVISSVIFVLLMILGMYFNFKYLSTGKIRISIQEDGIRYLWIKRFFLSKEDNILINWEQIVSYLFEEDRGLQSFELDLTNGLRYKINRINHFPFNDDYKKFKHQFPTYIRNRNKMDNIKITKGKTVFEEANFKYVLYLMAMILVFLIYDKMSHLESETNWGTIALLFSIISIYFIKVKKNK